MNKQTLIQFRTETGKEARAAKRMVHRHFQLRCLAACQGQCIGGKARRIQDRNLPCTAADEGCGPVAGAAKFHPIDGAAKAAAPELTDEEISWLEEPYAPHALAGVMAQNKPANAKEEHVWSTGNQKI